MSHLFSIPKGAPPFPPGSAPGTSSPPAPEHSPRPKWQHRSPDLLDTSPLSGATSQATPKGPSTLKQQEIMPLHKALTRSHLEAFSQDSSLVNEMREEYFWLHHPNFNHENTHDFSEVSWCMTKTADLFGSAIFKITEAWLGWNELWEANYSLMTWRKGLKFFRVVSPSEFPKVMGWWAYMNWMHYATSTGLPTAPGAERWAKMRVPSSITWGWCITNWASCVRNVLAAPQSCWRPFATMAGRAAYPQERGVQMSNLHWLDH